MKYFGLKPSGEVEYLNDLSSPPEVDSFSDGVEYIGIADIKTVSRWLIQSTCIHNEYSSHKPWFFSFKKSSNTFQFSVRNDAGFSDDEYFFGDNPMTISLLHRSLCSLSNPLYWE